MNFGEIIGEIQLKLIKEANEFAKLNQKYESDISLVSGRNCVDGKSVLGLFSLSLDKPVGIAFIEKVPGEKEAYVNELNASGFNFRMM